MKRKKIKTPNKVSVNIFSLIFVTGALLGTSIAFLSQKKLELNNIQLIADADFSSFFSLCFKYLKLPLAIWFCAFAKIGMPVICFLILIKAAGLSFTAAAVGAGQGLTGVFYSFFYIFMPSLAVMPAYLFLSEAAVNFIKKKLALKSYIFCFVISLIFIFLAVFTEMFVSPTITILLHGSFAAAKL